MPEEENIQEQPSQQLDGGTYEIIQNRLQKHKGDLQQRLQQLNDDRKEVFGSLETKLIANDRISTENNCIPRDIVSLGSTCIFGYNVHFGLRTDISLQDVFSVYSYTDGRFEPQPLKMIEDETFLFDFTNLYKYYRNTIFTRFSKIGNYLHMVFQLSESPTDIKTFKWLIRDNKLEYIDARSEHEYRFPPQHQFQWQEGTRDMQRYGTHPHISILDKVFVETVGGDLTIKIEDNTDDGRGILSEDVDMKDQTLDDGQFRFAELGNLIALEIKPFQEAPRYFVYNHKLQEVNKIESISQTCVLLPDEQGIIFPTGYYLQTGEYNIFDNSIPNVKFLRHLSSPNGEDHFYVFYSPTEGLYNLMSYNVITQTITTPIICNGYTVLENGELCYFRNENEQSKHHVIQIWQTPYMQGEVLPSDHQDTLLYKIGNKDIVKAMAEANSLITLLNKKDNYEGLYGDIAKASKDVLDSYYWLPEPETHQLNKPLSGINSTANAAIDEFKKVVQLRRSAEQQANALRVAAETIFNKAKSTSFKTIDDFVHILSQLRQLRGETISLKDVRYIDTDMLSSLEEGIAEQTEKISRKTVTFLLDDKALLPYHSRVKEKQRELGEITKVIEAKELEEEVNQIGTDLELLIDIVSNLDIEDTAHSTQIIDNISLIFSSLNQLKAEIKNKKNNLGSTEAKAEFSAQLKLIDQSVINYFDIADSPEKCDEYQTKLSVQLEELEGKFAENDEFIEEIITKREEIYSAFESRKSAILEKRNKRVVSLTSAADRILKGISKKAQTLPSDQEIHSYFAADLMVEKVRDIIDQLKELDDSGNSEELATKLKTAREDALRKLKDKNELYEDGENIIKLGQHKFGVNKQPLDVTMIFKNDRLNYHITGTDYYQPVEVEFLTNHPELWQQELVSENKKVYRGAYLAYRIFSERGAETLRNLSPQQMLETVQEVSSQSFTEGYTKGVHDADASKILQTLVTMHFDLDLLRFHPKTRALAQFFWHNLETGEQTKVNRVLKVAGEVLNIFPSTNPFDYILASLSQQVEEFFTQNNLLEPQSSEEIRLLTYRQIAEYLFEELKSDDQFQVSHSALKVFEQFRNTIKAEQGDLTFKHSYEDASNIVEAIEMIRQWVRAFLLKHDLAPLIDYVDEVACLILYKDESREKHNVNSPRATITGLTGNHGSIVNSKFELNYHDFMRTLQEFSTHDVPAFLTFKAAKHAAIEELKSQVQLAEFKPNVLTSFVRNRLIDEVYLPLIGDNLAKQLGTVGDDKRTDRMGMLLLISPPGYGKTTLMEYIANRLGLVFMKINGPAIGHEVTSVDPMSANNSAAREELKKLNLAFEMGNNVMLYIDDIQHCHPEFLQKFISLSDGTRKIEGVYEGKPNTYNLRGKKFCVVMAGNPYTEKGTKFQVPDMLANRSDIYNLGDIIGDSAHLFKLSLIENSLTSNSLLNQLRNKHMNDVYALLDRVENQNEEITLLGNHTNQEVNDYIAVLEKIIDIRNTVLAVNKQYIESAAMEDAYRTEPSFKLQGSYRDMNKLVAKVVPIMNDGELDTLLLSHYESESQTLTSSAEANLLKYKELVGKLSKEDKTRWHSIKETFKKNNKVKGLANQDDMAALLSQFMEFNDNLEGIKDVIKKNISNSK